MLIFSSLVIQHNYNPNLKSFPKIAQKSFANFMLAWDHTNSLEHFLFSKDNQFNCQEESSIMANGTMGGEMGAADKYRSMAQFTKAIGKMTFRTEKGVGSVQMDKYTKENGTMDAWRAREYFFALMVHHSQVNGSLECSTAMDMKNGQMALNMKVILHRG